MQVDKKESNDVVVIETAQKLRDITLTHVMTTHQVKKQEYRIMAKLLN